jgi:hypothetical protein
MDSLHCQTLMPIETHGQEMITLQRAIQMAFGLSHMDG